MYVKHHTKGIVISGRPESGESRGIFVFTEKFGLVWGKVQGARKLHSRLRGGVQDFSYGEFSLVHGKSGWKVVGAKTEKNFYEILKKSPEKIKIAANVLSLIKKLVDEEKEKTPLFAITINFLNYLEKAREEKIALTECLVLLKILNCLGYMRHDPELAIPVSSEEMADTDIETLAPRRQSLIRLINESLRATQINP